MRLRRFLHLFLAGFEERREVGDVLRGTTAAVAKLLLAVPALHDLLMRRGLANPAKRIAAVLIGVGWNPRRPGFALGSHTIDRKGRIGTQNLDHRLFHFDPAG